VKKVICLSTDKAAYPLMLWGISKALMEMAGPHQKFNDTTVCLTRYGNVMASRGSVIPLFLNKFRKVKP
jgi:UDP-glucose 4-epimerase